MDAAGLLALPVHVKRQRFGGLADAWVEQRLTLQDQRLIVASSQGEPCQTLSVVAVRDVGPAPGRRRARFDILVQQPPSASSAVEAAVAVGVGASSSGAHGAGALATPPAAGQPWVLSCSAATPAAKHAWLLALSERGPGQATAIYQPAGAAGVGGVGARTVDTLRTIGSQVASVMGLGQRAPGAPGTRAEPAPSNLVDLASVRTIPRSLPSMLRARPCPLKDCPNGNRS